MKKNLFIFLLTLAAMAGTPTNTAVNAPWEWEYVTGGSTTLSFIVYDSLTVLDKQPIQKGYEYIFAVRDSIDAARDSLKYRVDVYGNNKSTIMGSSIFGFSLVGTSPSQHVIPIGETSVGTLIKIKALRYDTNTADTTTSKLKKWELWKRRPVEVRKNWTLVN